MPAGTFGVSTLTSMQFIDITAQVQKAPLGAITNHSLCPGT